VETERRLTLTTAPGTVGGALLEAARLLHAAPFVDSADNEACELLAALLQQPRSWPSLNRDEKLDDVSRSALLTAAARRTAGAPLAYAVGCAVFRHLTLDVDERVLIPRPETEVLVDLVLASGSADGVAVDVGTGSGCIALALASEGQFTKVIATDVSQDALAVAQANIGRCAASLRAPVELRHGSLLLPLRGERVRVVVSNPPYVANDEASQLPGSVRDWEPTVALYSNGRGMAITMALVRQAPDVLEEGGLLAMEVDCRRASEVAESVATHGRYDEVSVLLDLTGRERFVLARRK
jgi:release factor glutamine methyltransferase